MTTANPYINPQHAKLHQKVLELHTGSAFVNPKSWRGKLRSWWNNNVSLTPPQIEKTVAVMLASSIIIAIIFTAYNFKFITFSMMTFIFACVLAETALSQIHSYGPNKELAAKNFSVLLKLDPSTKPMIQELKNHLNHSNILRKWWVQVDAIVLEMIENAKTKSPFSNKTHEEILTVMLEDKTDESILINNDQKAPQGTNNPSLRI